MPKLWDQSVPEHRTAVRRAILQAVDLLVDQGGTAAVSMTRAAEATGITRATLYKYFPDVQSLLESWHRERISAHLEHLEEIRRRSDDDPLRAVLTAYALMLQRRPAPPQPDTLHGNAHTAHAERHLTAFLTDIVRSQREAGKVRSDVEPADLASYCLHALNSARAARTEAQAHALVDVVMAGMAPQTA